MVVLKVQYYALYATMCIYKQTDSLYYKNMKLDNRQRRKEQARQAIVASAFELFTEKGFDKTTIADIAERASYAPRTFFLYFKSKEELLPAAMKEAADTLDSAMAERGEQSALEVLRAWITAMLENHKNVERQDVLRDDNSFQARRRFYLIRYLRPILVREFAKDLGVKDSTTKPKLVAAQAIAMLEAFDFNFTPRQRTAFIDDAILFLEAGIRAL